MIKKVSLDKVNCLSKHNILNNIKYNIDKKSYKLCDKKEGEGGAEPLLTKMPTGISAIKVLMEQTFVFWLNTGEIKIFYIP